MSPSSPSAHGESAPCPTGEALVRLLREELIKTQLIVLELNDRVLAKETDKADAIAILGQVELVLEEKINYISELDRALNEQIRELRQRLENAETESRARDGVIQDLAGRLETANQEVTRMHGVAGEYARDLAQTRERLSAEAAQHQQTQAELTSAKAQLADKTGRLNETEAALADTRAHLGQTALALSDTKSALETEQRRLGRIFNSALWRLGRPWRALFGPKV